MPPLHQIKMNNASSLRFTATAGTSISQSLNFKLHYKIKICPSKKKKKKKSNKKYKIFEYSIYKKTLVKNSLLLLLTRIKIFPFST